MNEAAATRRLVLQAVDEWSERGWLRRLDAAFARFVADLCPAAEGPALLAVALLANVEGQGHACIVLDEVFTERDRLLGWGDDALRALARTMDALPSGSDAWAEALGRCDAVDVGAVEGRRPLVLHGKTLYLRRYWTHERRVAADVARRCRSLDTVDEAGARRWLDRLFPVGDGPAAPVDWQKIACAMVLRGRFTIVTGGPGTGKTWTAARCLALLFAMADDPASLRVALAAPTGKAAARLRQSIEAALDSLRASLGDAFPLGDLAARVGPARTLHALLGTRPGTRRFRHDAADPLDVDVVVVDEASMIQVEMMDALLAALPATTRVVLLGDKDQLASVEAGAVLGELCRDAEAGRYRPETLRYVEAVCGERLPDELADPAGSALAQRIVVLRRSQRFDGDIGALAKAVNLGDADEADRVFATRTGGSARRVLAASPSTVTELASRGYRDYLDLVRRRAGGDHDAWVSDVLRAFEGFRVLCAVRDGEWGVRAVNDAIRARLAEDRRVAADGEWYEGRPVLVTRNDAALGVHNGDVGVVLRCAPDDGLRACFVDGGGFRSVGVGRLDQVESAFAMTVHKAQGSEFDHTVLVLPPRPSPVATRELVYTGITRARSAFTLVAADRDAMTAAIARSTRRASGLFGFVEEDDAPPC